MVVDERTIELRNQDERHQELNVTLHAFSDLTNVSPVVFVYLLKECYFHGTCKAIVKFCALQHRVHQVLYNKPRPGPAIFIACCLVVLPIFEQHCEGFSHLIISALRRFLKTGTTQEDLSEAKLLASQLFVTSVCGNVFHDERVLIKMLEVFGVRLVDIENYISKLEMKKNSCLDTGKAFVERYIFELIESQSYMSAVTLLEHFSFRESGESFLLKMMESKEYRAAEKWAAFIGEPMVRVLIQEYIDRKLWKHAYDVIRKNNLQEEFPEVYYKGKESSLKKLAEKGCWDVAESRVNSDRQLLEYLVYLAMEAGYSEKVKELCDKYSLSGFVNANEPEVTLRIRHLHLDELAIEDVIWVDEAKNLREATCQIERCKVVGVDCEWKPNYEKGSLPNKVSIMQIASEKTVFIIDLIKLSRYVPDILDDCLVSILHSPRILKLGYNFQCDVNQLAQSYGDLQCFKRFEMLLDIQSVFKESQGGLSGLAKKILGVGLNKTRRNSNWEQRPLSQYQLEYAALDAAVLVHIFRHVRNNLATDSSDRFTKLEWKSHIVSHTESRKKTKRKPKIKKESDAETVEIQPSS